MKTNRILSTAGMTPINSTRLRSYCNLMQGSLIDKWLFADEFVESHVCLVRHDYLINWDQDQLDKSQVIVVIDAPGHNNNYQFNISTPLNAANIKDVLNRISSKVEFKELNLTAAEPKKTVSRFKNAFAKIRKSFFGRADKKTAELKQKSRQQFITKLSKKIQKDQLPPFKIVLLGSPGSGKTTAIQSASAGKALNSDVSATDSVASDKAKTTVGIDYAEVQVTANRKIILFGTPGQVKFNFVWDMVGKNADGFIILLDMSRPEPLSYLKFYKKFLTDEFGKVSQIYCALTHCDLYTGDIPSFMDCIESEFSDLRGIYRVNARDKDDISIMLEDIYPQIKNNNRNEKSTARLTLLNR